MDKAYEMLGEDTGSMYDPEDDEYVGPDGEKQVFLLEKYYFMKKKFLIIIQELNNYFLIYFMIQKLAMKI